jgi:hypothetical protein
MLRRFNYTGRRTLAAKNVQIGLASDRSFTVGWDLTDEQLPPDALVFVEAKTSGSPTVLRFPFGTVSKPQPPSGATLKELPGSAARFSLKVVDHAGERGRLLAIADNLVPTGLDDEAAAIQHPLLPVNPSDLGNEVWRLDFTHNQPWLEVNNQIDNIMQIARSDARFFSLVYSSLIRMILTRILLVDEITETEGDSWQAQWLRWGIHWHPDKESPMSGERDECEESWGHWIEAVVSGFCDQKNVRERFALAQTGEEA